MFSKKRKIKTLKTIKRLFSFIIACYFKSLNTIQSFRETRKRDRLTLKDFHHIFQNVIAARQKDLEFDFDYNSFSFKLFSSIISDQFFRKSIFDSINDIDLFDLEVRSSFRSNRSTDGSTNTSRLSSSYHSSTRREFSRFVVMKANIKMIFLFEIIRLKDSFEYQTWQIEMRDQLILINLWHYVEIDEFSSSTILIVEISIEENLNVFVVSTSEKIRKFRIDNFKTMTIIRNQLKCNDRNLLKNEINVIKAWQILKKSFSSCESKILNDLFIKLWIIILIISQNVIDYARRFKKTLQDIREMIIEMFINDNILILYFHLDLDAKYEQYREHYDQTHDIVSVEFNLAMRINYAINKFLNICVNRFVFVESIVIMTIIVNTSSFVVLEIKNVVIIQIKHCTHCERNYHVKNECRNKHFHLKRDHQSRKD